MNDNATRDTRADDVLSPTTSLAEQSLSVDLARAEIDQMIATAHRYPRSLDVFIKKIGTMACYNESAAENCIYSLPRGGKPIIGPSIGFANIVATAWGNCVDGSRWVATDRKEKVVVAEGVFHDYETNRKTIISEQRRIVDSKGRLYSDDMIVVTSKAAGAIARRNAILQIVPRALWHPTYEDALQIVRGTVETFAEHKDKALKAFSQFGVKPEQVFMLLGLKGEADLSLEQIPVMRGLYTQLRDGVVTVEEMFDPRRMTGKGFDTVDNPLGDDEDPAPTQRAGVAQQTPQATQAKPQPAQQAQPSTPGTLEPDDEDGDGVAEVHDTRQVVAGDVAQTQPGQPAEAGKTPRKPRAPKADAAAATSPAAAQATAATPPAATAPTPIPDPRTTDAYKVYWRAIMAAATSATALEDRWKSPRERALRGNCSVIEDDLVEMKNENSARVAELKGAT